MAFVERFESLNSRIASLVHVSARDDVVSRSRHESFIASHLLGGCLAFLVFPVYVLAVGGLAIEALVAFVWLLSPVAIAVYLSLTGRLAIAHFISAVNLTGLITVVAALTGGLTSFVVPWMVIIPLEASLSNDRRVIYGSIAIACSGLLVLAVGSLWSILPQAPIIGIDPTILALLGLLSALVYAGGLAASVQLVHNRSSQAIEDGEQRYRLLAENATDLITRHDAEGEVVFASPAARRVVGETPATLASAGLVDRIHPADREAYRRTVTRCIATCEPESIEFRLHRDETEDTQERWAEMRMQPIAGQSATGGTQAFVAVTRDVTVSKRQSIDLLKARDDAESASRAKTQFLATMSHELRTPLNAIIGFADILSRELFGAIGEKRYLEYAGLIHESGEHLLSVVNEILDMSKIEAGKYTIEREFFDVGPLLESCCELLRYGAEKKSIELTTDVPADLPRLNADKRACKQMLLNLLSNAIKFTEEGGHVRLQARRSKDMLHLNVIDDGIGIAAEDLPNLGAPFVQAESTYARKFEGSGLGLCVVTGLAKLHDGELKLESELGSGTTVTVALPMPRVPSERSREEIPASVDVYSVRASVA